MRRGLTQPGWRPDHSYSVIDSFLLAVGFFGVAMLALVALSYPIVVVGFGAGLLLRPAIRTARTAGRQVNRTLRRLDTEASGSGPVRRDATGE